MDPGSVAFGNALITASEVVLIPDPSRIALVCLAKICTRPIVIGGLDLGLGVAK